MLHSFVLLLGTFTHDVFSFYKSIPYKKDPKLVRKLEQIKSFTKEIKGHMDEIEESFIAKIVEYDKEKEFKRDPLPYSIHIHYLEIRKILEKTRRALT